MPISIRRVIARRRVVGVQRREHEVAGERGLDAICAVSRSRISPTMMMSGSARIIERRPVAKVRPACGVDLDLGDARRAGTRPGPRS